MPRISDEELTRLKQTPLLDLASSRGIALEKRGTDFALSCPFHDEKTASCIITPSKNVFHCFGCGKGGSAVDFIMQIEQVSFRHAAEILRANPNANGPKTTNKLECPIDPSGHILNQVMQFYQDALTDDEPTLNLLERRGLLDAIEPFKLGAANRTLGLRLPYKNRKDGAEIRMRLMEKGVYRSTGREHLNGCLVVPFTDGDNVAEMYGRKVNTVRKGTPKHLYLSGPHQGVLNKDNLAHEVILTEAPLDAMSFYVAGVRSVTTTFGTSGLTEEIYKELKKARRVHIAFDNDDAGNRAAKEAGERLIKDGVEVNRVEFKVNQDANDVLRYEGKKALLKLVKKSTWVGGIAVPDKPALPAKPLAACVPPLQPATTNNPEEPQATKEALKVSPLKDEATISYEGRQYRIRNLKKNVHFGIMKVNLLVKKGERFHVDNLDLYIAKAREHYAKSMSVELGITIAQAKKDLGQLLLLLDEYQGAQAETEDAPFEMSKEEHEAATEFLKDPNLMEKILEDFNTLGVIGEQTNKLTGYLAATSRKLSKPLAVVVQSSSAAGKSSLMEAILKMVPEEEKVTYSAMTGQSLFYMEGGNLKHKVLAIAEEEGAERASYALKILQSEGKLKIASTGKDADTGRHTTSAYEVEGPTAIFTTTTSIDIDEELLNRCLVLTVNEDEEQTAAIQNEQRASRSVQRSREKVEALVTLHQNAQRLLKPLDIVNPYAPHLTFPSHRVRLRRDHMKYLTIIDVVALLHQHQREQHEGEKPFIKVQPSDIDVANELVRKIMGRSLDELPPQTRRVLQSITDYVKGRIAKEELKREGVIFTRKQLRDALNVGATQLHLHLQRLTELEYVAVHRLKGSRTMLYRLAYFADDDVSTFALTTGAEAEAKANQIRGIFAPNSGQIRVAQIISKLRARDDLRPIAETKFFNSEKCKPAKVVKLKS